MILNISLTLESDGIFSSGHSVPGGDDINVYTDEMGLPYFRGSSFKGILRDSVTNYLSWIDSDKKSELIADLFGTESFAPIQWERRLKFTDFILQNTEKNTIFTQRAFTSLENGMAKEGSLRSAKVICKGCIFSGQVFCHENDVELVTQGLAGMKYIGLLRSRGFGHISLEIVSEKENQKTPAVLEETSIISYTLRSLTPVSVTNIGETKRNNYGSHPTILGSMIRGYTMQQLSQKESAFFEGNKVDLLHSCFLNLVPKTDETHGNIPFIPSLKGYYEKKDEKELETMLLTGSFKEGKKRAKLGEFMAFSPNEILYTSTEKHEVGRIGLGEQKGEEKTLFTTTSLGKEQEFQGYILLKDPKLAPMIVKMLEGDCFIGADRYQGFGHCSISNIKGISSLPVYEHYSYKENDNISSTIYLAALSPFSMVNDCGECCGIDVEVLAEKLGVKSVKIEHCSTSTGEYSSFNNQWMSRDHIETLYQEGSVFQIICDRAPTFQAIQTLQKEGLGIRKAEGYGQVLCLNPSLLEGEKSKRKIKFSKNLDDLKQKQIVFRQNKIKWIRSSCEELDRMHISDSRLGNVQRLCEGGSKEKLFDYLQKNVEEAKAERAYYFREISDFIHSIFKEDFAPMMGRNDDVFKLDCLTELLDYKRKKQREGREFT